MHTFFRISSGVFGAALMKMGIGALSDQQAAAKGFGLPASTAETLSYMPAWGVRDIGFGLSILTLLGAESAGLIAWDGGKAAALVTALGACVGLADSQIIRLNRGEGAIGHAVGASAMAVSAAGLLMTA